MINKQPGTEEIIKQMVSAYLSAKYPISRDSLLSSIRQAMKIYHLIWLDCDGFSVEMKKEGIKWHSSLISMDGCCPRCGTREYQILYIYHADTDNEKHVCGCKQGHVFKVLCGWPE